MSPRILWVVISSLPGAYLIGLGVYNLAEVFFPSVRDDEYGRWEDAEESDDGININIFFFAFRPGYRRRVIASGKYSPEVARRQTLKAGLALIALGIVALFFVLVEAGLLQDVPWPWQNNADDF